MLRNLNVKPVAFENRLFFLLAEDEDDSTFPHGVIMAPAGVAEAEARSRIDRAYRRAIELHPETWNFDDVINHLEAAGFTHIQCGYWVEKG